MSTSISSTSTITNFRIRKRKTASVLGFIIAFAVMFFCMAIGDMSTDAYNFVLILTFSSALLGAFSGEPRKR
jgi:hypothetical protein